MPPFDGYEPPGSVMVPIGGKTYDVLSFDPAGARELLARAGFPNGVAQNGTPLHFEYLLPQLPHSQPIAEVLQQQWHRNLHISVRLKKQELKTYIYTISVANSRWRKAGEGPIIGTPIRSWICSLLAAPSAASWSDATI